MSPDSSKAQGTGLQLMNFKGARFHFWLMLHSLTIKGLNPGAQAILMLSVWQIAPTSQEVGPVTS